MKRETWKFFTTIDNCCAEIHGHKFVRLRFGPFHYFFKIILYSCDSFPKLRIVRFIPSISKPFTMNSTCQCAGIVNFELIKEE